MWFHLSVATPSQTAWTRVLLVHLPWQIDKFTIMGKSNVEIYLRVRPSAKSLRFSSVDNHANTIEFNLPRDESGGHVNNQRVHYDFGFNGVFGGTTSQEVIFSQVAEKAVLSAVQGYNATIFAYGQTGSGKTWTITGGINRYISSFPFYTSTIPQSPHSHYQQATPLLTTLILSP